MGFIRNAIATAIDLAVAVFIDNPESDDPLASDDRTIDQIPFADLRQADGTDVTVNAGGQQVS